MGTVSCQQGQWAPLLATLPLCQVPLGHHAKMPPTLHTVFPKSILYLGNTCSPWLRTAQKNGREGAVTISALLQSHGSCSRAPGQHWSQPSRSPEGRHLPAHTAEGTSLGGLTWRRKERNCISTGDSSHPTREGGEATAVWFVSVGCFTRDNLHQKQPVKSVSVESSTLDMLWAPIHLTSDPILRVRFAKVWTCSARFLG